MISLFPNVVTSKLYLVIGAAFVLAGFSGCAKLAQQKIVDDQFYFDRGMKYMEKKDYVKAIDEFQAVVDYSGSEIVDKGQFMLGEAHYMNEDFITAAYEYERVYMDLPSSEYAAEAWYKKAMCWFMESPKSYLDQENTRLAIDEFKRFIENFPFDKRGEDAREKINELQEKLARKDYLNAEQYRKRKQYDAALIYYNSVIDQFPQSIWIGYCRYGMGLVNMKLIYRELKNFKKIMKSANPDTMKAEKSKEELQVKLGMTINLFIRVIESDTDSRLKKKASQKQAELEGIVELQ